jgi:hypothetical protein
VFILSQNSFLVNLKSLNLKSFEALAKVCKRELVVIPAKLVPVCLKQGAGIQSFQYAARISGFPFTRE